MWLVTKKLEFNLNLNYNVSQLSLQLWSTLYAATSTRLLLPDFYQCYMYNQQTLTYK